MIKHILLMGTAVLLLTLSGCAAIHFENGEVVADPEDREFSLTYGLFEDEEESDYDYNGKRYRKWYHHTTLQIAELSNPLETSLVCSGLEWNQVTTEVTPFDAVIGLIDNLLLWPASSAALDLWSPWSIEYSCRDQR